MRAGSLHYALESFESMFLVRELQLLKAAACPAWQPSPHSDRQPRGTAPPKPPSAEEVAQLHVHVRDDGTLPLAEAVEEVRRFSCLAAIHSCT